MARWRNKGIDNVTCFTYFRELLLVKLSFFTIIFFIRLLWQMFTQLHFTYEQESHPEEFFIPYVWKLVMNRRWTILSSYFFCFCLFSAVQTCKCSWNWAFFILVTENVPFSWKHTYWYQNKWRYVNMKAVSQCWYNKILITR